MELPATYSEVRMLVQIRFIASGANSALGGFSAGDTARVGAAFARHLVEDARVAVYVEAPKSADDPKRMPRRKG